MWLASLSPLIYQQPGKRSSGASSSVWEFRYCCPRCLRLLPDECTCARDLARRRELADLILMGVL